MPTYCPPKHSNTVYNIESIALGNDQWKSTQDHSKWVITTDGFKKDSSSSPYACIGGVNRQHSQATRGGATMCISSKSLNEELYASIRDYEKC